MLGIPCQLSSEGLVLYWGHLEGPKGRSRTAHPRELRVLKATMTIVKHLTGTILGMCDVALEPQGKGEGNSLRVCFLDNSLGRGVVVVLKIRIHIIQYICTYARMHLHMHLHMHMHIQAVRHDRGAHTRTRSEDDDTIWREWMEASRASDASS